MKKVSNIFIIILCLLVICQTVPAIENSGLEKNVSYMDMYEIKNEKIDIKIDNYTLEVFSNFYKNLEEQGTNLSKDNINLSHIDKDLYFLEPLMLMSKDRLLQKFEKLSKDREDCKEIYNYLVEFYKKYDVIEIRKGYVDFYTVENKDILIENKDYDSEIMRKMSKIYWEERVKEIDILNNPSPKWSTVLHGEITRIPAEEMIRENYSTYTFTESQLNIMEQYAPEPDND